MNDQSIPALMQHRKIALEAGEEFLAYMIMLLVLALYENGFDDPTE